MSRMSRIDNEKRILRRRGVDYSKWSESAISDRAYSEQIADKAALSLFNSVSGVVEASTKVPRSIRKALYDERVDKGLINYIKEHIASVANAGVSLTFTLRGEEEFLELLAYFERDQSDQRIMIVYPNGSEHELSPNGIKNIRKSLIDKTDEYHYAAQLATTNYGGTYRLHKRIVDKSKFNASRVGGFLPYLNHSEYDLSRYQFYSEFKASNYKDNCLFHALKLLGLSVEKLNQLRSFVVKRSVSKKSLGLIAKHLNIRIYVTYSAHERTDDMRTNRNTYGDNTSTEEYQLALYEDHYFIQENLECLTIAGSRVKTSLGYVRTIIEKTDLYTPISVQLLNKLGYNPVDYSSLKYSKSSITRNFKNAHCGIFEKDEFGKVEYIGEKLFGVQDHQARIDEIHSGLAARKGVKVTPYVEGMITGGSDTKAVYFFDFECYRVESAPGENERFKEYQVSFVESNAPDSEAVVLNYENGVNLGTKMLTRICEQMSNRVVFVDEDLIFDDDEEELVVKKDTSVIKLYAHNCKFDSCFFDHDDLHQIKLVMKEGSFYGMLFTFYHKGIPYKFDMRDSYKHISAPLSSLPGRFKFTDKYPFKEVIPYNIYRLSNIIKGKFSIESACESLRQGGSCKADIARFVNNIDLWDCRVGNNEFNHIKYSAKYNIMDVLILREAFGRWQRDILAITGINICDTYTSASLSHRYMISQGVYDGVYSINQMVRKYIHDSVYGGRCMSNRNQKLIRKGVIQDLDAVGLYTAAMYRLSTELGGFLKGMPIVLTSGQLNMNFLNSVDGYFVTIIVHKMKDRAFPLIAHRSVDGMDYSTESVIGVPRRIGKIGLEDLINFCQAEFTIVEGVYFNSGRNPVVGTIMKDALFEARLELKKIGCPLQEVLKLIMNSAYGKTIQSEDVTKTQVCSNAPGSGSKKDGSQLNDRLVKDYNNIHSLNRMGESQQYVVETYTDVRNHFGAPHIGSEILEMSKRQMNEVMCLAEDSGIEIFYQDTDSMHLYAADIPKLANLFKEKHGRELVGMGLGQFHSDFSSKILDPKTIHSRMFICLGKKAYMDVLIDEISDNEDYHVRLKGIPLASIDHYNAVHNYSYEELYMKMYNGEKVQFDLTCEGQKAKFEIKTFCSSVVAKFNRIVGFK